MFWDDKLLIKSWIIYNNIYLRKEGSSQWFFKKFLSYRDEKEYQLTVYHKKTGISLQLFEVLQNGLQLLREWWVKHVSFSLTVTFAQEMRQCPLEIVWDILYY